MRDSTRSWAQVVRHSLTTNPGLAVSKPCAVYWDIENVSVQSGQSVNQIVHWIRDKVIRVKGLTEIEFVCVYGVGKLTPSIEKRIRSERIKIFECDHRRNAADLQIIDRIRQFLRVYGRVNRCSLILISGDSDFVKTLIRCKIKYRSRIYLIHREMHRNDFLDVIADEVYLLDNGTLRCVTKSSDVAVIKVEPSQSLRYSSIIEHDLQSMFEHQGAMKDSVYADEDRRCLWIGFPSKELAKEVARDRHNQPYRNHPLAVHYEQYPPAAVTKYFAACSASSVHLETLNLLHLLTPNSFSLSRSSSVTSTLSLPFKGKSSAYLIVTGFPHHLNADQRRHRLNKVFDHRIKSFHSTHDYVWLELHYPYQAKYYAGKINDFDCDGFKLTATIHKQLPKCITHQPFRPMISPDPLPSKVTKVIQRPPIPSTDTPSHQVIVMEEGRRRSFRDCINSIYLIRLIGFTLIIVILILLIIWTKFGST